MNLTVRIPDDVAIRITADGNDLERHTLEALLVEEYRAGRMSKPEFCDALGLEELNEIDGLLKAHGVYYEYTMADLEEERRAASRLGFSRP